MAPSRTFMTPLALRCAYRDQPLGIDDPAPRLSWELPVPRRGARQTAYQVLVASDPALLRDGVGDVWDSGRVLSAQSVQVRYAGAPLQSGRRYHWAVRAWDGDGQASPYSAPSWWEMGLLHETDWRAQWITMPESADVSGTPRPAPYFRTAVTLDQPVVAARAYICGLGYYALYLNGQKVGDHVLDPTVARYDLRALYVTHDVTAGFTPGENVIGVILGTGWYNCHTQEVWNFAAAPWRNEPRLLLQVHLTLADGSTRVVTSDATWQVATGPILFDGLRNGETYDARAERPDWARPGASAEGWRPVEVGAAPGGILAAQTMPCKVMQTLTPLAVREVRPGVFVADLGQNIAGWAQLTVSGPAGTEVTLRYAEKLTAEGDIDQSNIDSFIKSGDCQTDRYILNGAGVEVWEPRFTYHGFRYVRIEGFPGTPGVDNLRGRVVHTAFPTAGEFACSNELLNAIQRATRWSYIGNFVGIPTDCPHREKNGWTGDAQLAAETGLFNFGAAPAYVKWLDDIADAQRPSGQLPGIVPTGGWGYNWGSGPAWDSILTHLPWYLYLYEGDTTVLDAHYAGMRRYVDYMTRMATGHLVSFGLGDWCHVNEYPEAPVTVTSTGYYYANCRLLAQIAGLLGQDDDAAHYGALAQEIKTAFTRAFYDPARGTIATGDQTSQACALFQGLVAPTEVGKVLDHLVAEVARTTWHPTFGILGAKYVLNALSDLGRADVAYALATRTDYPSWGHWLAQGATTLWEDWGGSASRNHIMFGDISAWCFKTLAGLQPDPAHPGFGHTRIHPHPIAGLTWASAVHQTPYGVLRSAWEITEGLFVLDVQIPANATATVILPTNNLAHVTENGQPAASAEGVTPLVATKAGLPLRVVAGTYRFIVDHPAIIPLVG